MEWQTHCLSIFANHWQQFWIRDKKTWQGFGDSKVVKRLNPGYLHQCSKNIVTCYSSCVHLWQALMYVSHWDLSCRGQLTCATQSSFSVCKSQNLIQKFLPKILSHSKMFLEFTLHSSYWLSSSKFLLNVELATNGNVLKEVYKYWNIFWVCLIFSSNYFLHWSSARSCDNNRSAQPYQSVLISSH